ncbi:sensor histidine kinase [Segetibacter aerophilus]|uniref:histidine kinase n=1 Tax=Segetibacter aerophilus TaxID=670293 RepID=A0A512B7G1_9BACT|nr:ATP-binding protein [Segetibacter aerophilus]GEO07896.1 hypothetical protein SAE01_03920 [Segetibacter aerophilus]
MEIQQVGLLLEKNAELEKVLAAKNRELEIEAALERVRSRAMAMHHSHELAEAANLLFLQVQTLGLPVLSCGYNIWERNETICMAWMSDQSGLIQQPFKIPLTESPAFIKFYNSKQRGEEFYTEEVRGEALAAHYRYMITLPGFEKIVKGFEKAGFTLPTSQVNNVVNFSHGNLVFITYQPTPEAHDIFKRFGKVFDQTYTRFLDLQKAEAQTKAAQIELGLERIRTRAMAMQKSDELAEAAKLLYNELRALNINPVSCGYMFVNEEQQTQTAWVTLPDGTLLPDYIVFPLSGDQTLNDRYNAWKQKEPLHKARLEGEENKEHHRFLASQVPADISANIFAHIPDNIVFYSANFSAGYLMIIAAESFSSEDEQTIIRFAKVFEITYTRFLDLQKAEAQVREARIEAALERVRSKALAMHKSDDLQQAAVTLFNELEKIEPQILRCGIAILDPMRPRADVWIAVKGKEGNAIQVSGSEPLDTHPMLLNAYEAWKRQEDYSHQLQGDELMQYYNSMAVNTFQATVSESHSSSNLAYGQRYFNAVFTHGSLFVFFNQSGSEAVVALVKRFVNVFDLAYKRFLDLENVEAQAREAQIQLALERVRARTMAMQKSDELTDVAALLFRQVSDLGIKTWTTGFNVWSEDNNFYTDYITNPQGGFMDPYVIDASIMPISIKLRNAKIRGEEFFVNSEEGEALAEVYRELAKFGKDQFKGVLESGFEFPTSQYEHFVFGSKVSLIFITYEPVPKAHDIFRRFGKVFEQTYTRFLDLQKAEAQAREARIELALERVRARTMAMQKSTELLEISSLLFEQVKELGVTAIQNSIGIVNEEAGFVELSTTIYGSHLLRTLNVPINDPFLMVKAVAAWKAKQTSLTLKFEGQELKNYNELRNSFYEKKVNFPEDCWFVYINFFSKGWLSFSSDREVSGDILVVLRRFAAVFEQTYIRFLDLQKAEAHAREAQIEAAMERLRTKAMTMQTSGELATVVKSLYIELKRLDESLNRAFIMMFDEQTGGVTWWMAGDDEALTEQAYRIPYSNNPPQLAYLKGWKERQEKWLYVMEGNEKKEWDAFLFNETELSTLPPIVIQFMKSFEKIYLSASFNSFGCLTTGSVQSLSSESFDILVRFSKVFDLSYTRSLDLKQAEAQVKEAKIEAALEKIRSSSLTMHHSNELVSVIGVMFEKLKELDVLLGTVAIWLFNKATMDSIFWVGNDWQQPAMVHLPYDEQLMKEDTNYKDGWEAWLSGESFINKEYSKQQKDRYFEYVLAHNDLVAIPPAAREMLIQANKYIACLLVEKHSALYFDCWHGATYNEESVEILKRVAKVFEQAYVRFLDLQKAEALAVRAEQDLAEIKAARKKAEETLVELKSTQAQLIQAEKMASLGELTAGIAHEIQNPLNFVNNFSEINKELLEELKSELNEGDKENAISIANDVINNEQKINEHGRRADAIVKGMLQHSRANAGKKEPTDINALADEYLRLSYHGLRAKDKNFNADFTTDLDDNVGTIKVVPQDIGRVLLNLYNNAFYAVFEKMKRLDKTFKPLVSVATKRVDNKVEIIIKDNGIGIPEKVVDKIFQPFFTTKPTGQGTGLGLSLSYDIIKAHGGELKVETEEGKSAIFIIELPI